MLSTDLTTTQLMSWLIANQLIWAFGIQLDRKTMTDSALCPTHRRYIDALTADIQMHNF